MTNTKNEFVEKNMTMERLLNIIQKNVPQLFMLVFIIAWSGAKAQYPYNF